MQDPLRIAFEHHRQGRLGETALLSERALREQPGHIEALHLLGVVANQQGDHGRAEILTGVASGGPPHVKVFAGASGDLLASFFAYGASFLGGVRVGAEDVDGDGKADILTGAGPGAGPHVKAFRAADLAELDSFFAFSSALADGVFVG